MANTDHVGRQGKTGAAGRRGSQGARGETGAKGHGHLKRIAKMQRELDGLTATVATLSRGDCATPDVK